MRKTLRYPLAAALALAAFAGTVGYRPAGAAPPPESRPVAPELVGGPWLNTPDGKPVTLASRKGKVTIVHFWTFG